MNSMRAHAVSLKKKCIITPYQNQLWRAPCAHLRFFFFFTFLHLRGYVSKRVIWVALRRVCVCLAEMQLSDINSTSEWLYVHNEYGWLHMSYEAWIWLHHHPLPMISLSFFVVDEQNLPLIISQPCTGMLEHRQTFVSPLSPLNSSLGQAAMYTVIDYGIKRKPPWNTKSCHGFVRPILHAVIITMSCFKNKAQWY